MLQIDLTKFFLLKKNFVKSHSSMEVMLALVYRKNSVKIIHIFRLSCKLIWRIFPTQEKFREIAQYVCTYVSNALAVLSHKFRENNPSFRIMLKTDLTNFFMIMNIDKWTSMALLKNLLIILTHLRNFRNRISKMKSRV